MSKAKAKLHYLAEWRAFRDLSLRKLALRMESQPGQELISANSLNRIEKGVQPLTPELLHALAHAFDCGPEDIIGINPLIKPEIIDLMAIVREIRGLDRKRILQATQILRAIA